jgi:hypothetical protein
MWIRMPEWLCSRPWLHWLEQLKHHMGWDCMSQQSKSQRCRLMCPTQCNQWCRWVGTWLRMPDWLCSCPQLHWLEQLKHHMVWDCMSQQSKSLPSSLMCLTQCNHWCRWADMWIRMPEWLCRCPWLRSLEQSKHHMGWDCMSPRPIHLRHCTHWVPKECSRWCS